MRTGYRVEIIFEDDDLLVVMKPAGLVVNRAESVDQETLQDWTEEHLGLDKGERAKSDQNQNLEDINLIFKQRSGIGHRLDKETSGVMVIGKNPESLKNLMSQFKDRKTRKEYLALVYGLIQPEAGIINLPIARSIFNRHRFHIDVFGKAAITEYRVERIINGFSLVRLFPKTGRTHQIRVHMAHIGHPLVGDELYSGRKRSTKDRLWCPRHFLHAAGIELLHPSKGELVRFEAELPKDLREALNAAERV